MLTSISSAILNFQFRSFSELRNRMPNRSRIQIIFIALLFAISFLFFLPTYKWIYAAFFGLYDQINLVLLILLLTLFFYQYRSQKRVLEFHFQFKTFPFLLLIGSVVGYLIMFNAWNINLALALFFLLYLFGLLGLFVNSKTWAKAIIPFFLLSMTLPFGSLMDVYIGFPLRLAAVDFIEKMFSSFGISNVAKDSIITIENNATQVDFSCSGLKGIWAGLLFYFSLTWMENLRINLLWLGNMALLLVSLIAANMIRIALIVWLSVVMQKPEMAQAIHSALGVIGFVFSCALVYFITRTNFFIRFNKKGLQFSWTIKNPLKNSALISKVMAGLLFLLMIPGIYFLQKPQAQVKPDKLQLSWSEYFSAEALALNPKEELFLSNQGGQGHKISFENNGLQGSILIIKSGGWRSHHNPEYCIKAGGNKIMHISTVRLNDATSLKWLKVNEASSACYWFQGPDGSTDDFSTRIWAEILGKQNDWLLVSVVFNNETEFDNDSVQETLIQINKTLKNYYHKTPST